MDPQEDPTDRDITLTVVLPGGQETTAAVHGSKPVMDVLVTLCAQHHLIPSDHAIRLISTNQNHISFKPNSLIGSLDFERVVLHAKGSDDSNKKKPHVPVATVRLLINYKKSHKAVVRVNPRVPLSELMPAVCEKCEFDPDFTILLRTCQSEEPLDLTKTLNDYEIRELYAKEMKGGDEEQKTPVKEKNQREKGNKGFFSLFRKSKKTSEQTESAPSTPELNSGHVVRATCLNGHSTLPTAPADMPKKRRAPQPPLTASQSDGSGLHTSEAASLSECDTTGKQGLLSRISSTESYLKRTKRRAPPPPCDGPSPSESDNKEKVQGDYRRSDQYRTPIADQCHPMTEVISELMKSLQARQQRALSSENSSTSWHHPRDATEDQVSDLCSERCTSDAEFKAPPGCQLLRNPSEKEGLTTFTVVPKRRQQSRKCFEMDLSLQAPDNAKADQEPYPRAPEDLEVQSTEEAVHTELYRNRQLLDETEGKSEVQHLQNLDRKNQECTDNEIENLEQNDDEKQSIHPKYIELGGLESFQRGPNSLEPSGRKKSNLELRDTELKSSEQRNSPTNNLQPTINPNIQAGAEDKEEVREYVEVENENEKNWVKEYKERRKRFLGGIDDSKTSRKLDTWGSFERGLRNGSREEESDYCFPSPPPPVYWYKNDAEEEPEEEREKKNESEKEVDVIMSAQVCGADNDQWLNLDLSPPPVPHFGVNFVSHSDHSERNAIPNSNTNNAPSMNLSKLKEHGTKTNPEENTSSIEYKYNSTAEPCSVLSHPNSGSTSKAHSTFDPCPQGAASLFAMAVFQRAKRSKAGLDLNHSRRRELPEHTHSN